MYNEESCRSCGKELTPLFECKYCDETLSWSCSNCNILLRRIHTHPAGNRLLKNDQEQDRPQIQNHILGNQLPTSLCYYKNKTSNKIMD